MSSTRNAALKLYKLLLRNAEKMSAYNFRMYAVRRTRDAFKENKNTTDPSKIKTLLADGQRNLEILKRQVLIHNLYQADKLVIEQTLGKQESH